MCTLFILTFWIYLTFFDNGFNWTIIEATSSPRVLTHDIKLFKASSIFFKRSAMKEKKHKIKIFFPSTWKQLFLGDRGTYKFQHIPGESLVDDDDVDGKNDTWAFFRRDCSIVEDFLVRIKFCGVLIDPKSDGSVEIAGKSSINWI